MINNLLIFLGAGLGGLLRYWISTGTYRLVGREFPYGTLLVNATGCLLMGFLFVILIERMDILSGQLRALILIWVLGGYTTFSSFSIETWNLFESGAWMSASLNILLSVALCITLTWLGVIGERSL